MYLLLSYEEFLAYSFHFGYKVTEKFGIKMKGKFSQNIFLLLYIESHICKGLPFFLPNLTCAISDHVGSVNVTRFSQASSVTMGEDPTCSAHYHYVLVVFSPTTATRVMDLNVVFLTGSVHTMLRSIVPWKIMSLDFCCPVRRLCAKIKTILSVKRDI